MSSFNKSILVVDDDFLTRKLIITMLTSLNLDIVEAGSAHLALELIKSQCFKAIISDIKMPGMDGLEFLRKMKELNLNIPVIYISGYTSKEIALEALRLGAFDFAEKPFERESLVSIVKRALDSQRDTLFSKLQDLNLNPTQIKVLEMLMKGMSNKEIADIVNLSEQGIKYHISSLLKKFNSQNRMELSEKIRTLSAVVLTDQV